MDYEAITALAKHHKQAFGRIVKCEIYKLEDGKVLALSQMHDDYHDMSLAVVLDDQHRIEEIGGKMSRIPYALCEKKPLEMLAALKGIGVLERGVLKKVRERIPRKLGCTHLYEMIESTFRAVFAGAYSIYEQPLDEVLALDMEEDRQFCMQSQALADTCFAFNVESVDEAVLARARKKVEEAEKKMAAIEVVKRGG